VVAHLLRLKLTLTANGLRRNPWVAVGLVLGALYGLAALVAALAAFGYVSTQAFVLREMTGVLLGGALVLAWWIVPLVAFGLDSTLEPVRFAPYPLPRRTLFVGLTLAALLGVPGVLTVLGALGSAVLWWREPVAFVVALIGAVLAVLTCVLGARALSTALARVVVRRRVREIGLGLVVLPLMFAGPILSRALPAGLDLRQADVAPVVRVVGWTPLGAAWALAPDVAAGRWAQAGARLLVALATVAVLGWAWQRALGHALVEPVRETTKRRDRGLGLLGRLPATPLGAVTARCLTYWVRDPRYATAVVLVPVLPLVFALVDPGRQLVLVAAPLAGFLVGWSICADVANDGTAFWLHVASPLRGGADRWGRALAAGGIAVVAVGAIGVASAFVAHRPDAIPALIGCGLGAAGSALGVSSVASALVVYPVRQPGDSPFSVRQGATLSAFLTQLVGWTLVGALTSPVIVLTALAIAGGHPAAGWAALVVGPVLGAGVLAIGAWLGGRTLERTAPDLLRRLVAMT
jgi:ABC-2 type transport system permease protein